MSEEPTKQNNPQASIDKRIKQAQRRGMGIYLLSGSVTLIVLVSVLVWLFFVKGYKVVVGPSEAFEDRQIELVSGLAWVTRDNIYTLGGDINIQVSSPTFESANLAITSQSPSTIEIVLLPSPAIINAQVSALAPNVTQSISQLDKDYLAETQWFLNGTLIHVGSSLLHKTPPGEYSLQVKNSYYQSASESLSLSRAEEVELQTRLVPIVGKLSLNSIPAGADVSINGEAIGQTPLELTLGGGDYDVEVTSDDFQSIEETIALQSGFLNPGRNYQLIPKQGELTVSASPSDGLLLVNNIEYPLGRLVLSTTKSHKVEYKKAGHTSFVQTVSLSKDKPQALNIQLTALYGELSFTGNVPANISINGKQVGALPQSSRLLSVPHIIEARLEGYRTQKKTVTPRPNTNTEVSFNLLTEFQARRQEGRPLVVTEMGIQMLKFRGNEFTMGSPANETGRRRNEHQIEVDFEREFWMSTTEITQAQFAAFITSQQSGQVPEASKLPVTDISWLQAAQFCNWLSIQEGLPVFYRFRNGRYAGVNKDAIGYRLPSEAEWEWVAKKAKRGVSTTYVWGNQTKLRDNLGNFADKSIRGEQLIILDDYDDGQKGLAPVGSFKADRTGIYDLAGNASEWVHDFYTNSLPDTSKQHIDYLGASNGEAWVIKGGNYQTGRLRELRAAFREFSSSAKPNVGFRIARYDN